MKWKQKKQTFLIVFLIVSVLLSLCFLTFQNNIVEASVSVVDSNIAGSYAVWAIRLPKQHKIFQAVTRYWYWYCTGSQIGFKTSLDGNSWTSFTSIASENTAAYFDVYFSGTKVYYARDKSAGTNLYFRSGTPNSDGTITWDASEQFVLSDNRMPGDPSICVDSNGYPWIAYPFAVQPNAPCIVKSDYNNGTWHTTSGYPYALTTKSYFFPTIFPLLNGQIYAAYVMAHTSSYAIADYVYGRLFNGTAWKSETQISTSKVAKDCFQEWDALSDVYGNGHVAFINLTAHNILYIQRNSVTGIWGSEEQVYANVGDSRAVSISYFYNDVYCFWNGYPTASHYYYSKRQSGVWGSAVDWVDDSSDGQPNKYNLITSGKTYNGEILVGWLAKSSSPYSAKFSILNVEGDATPPTYSNLGVNTTIAGNPCKFYCKWTDDIALSGFIFGSNNTGVWQNNSFATLSGNPAWSNVTKTLNSTVGVHIAYRFWCNDTSNNWADTGLTFLTTSSEDVTIEIYESWISDTRLDYGTQVTIKFRHRYSNNQTACETGSSWVNGTECAINSTGWITYTKTYSAVVKYTFTISQVNVKGYTTFQMVTSDAEVVWDRLKVDSYGTGDNRADVDSLVLYWWKLKYEYDSVAFTNSKGNCSIGGNPATWSSYNTRWELNVLLPSTPQSYSQSLTFTDNTYGLTVITGTTSQSVIADRVNINSFTVYDNRINVGATASFSVSGKYDFDNSSWSGTYTLNQTISKTSVGKYWYQIQSITDSTYGLTAFQQTASNLYVIFDKLTVTFSANDTSPDTGETVTISWTITRQYDSSSVTSFTIDISRNTILWQTVTNNSLTDIAYTDVTRIYTLYPTTVTDNTYGITAAQSNSATVTWGTPPTPPTTIGFNLYFELNGKLAFQNDIDTILTMQTTSGTLNGTAGTLTMDEWSGTLQFYSLDTATIKLTWNFEGSVQVAGDQGKASRNLISGESFTIAPANTITINWIKPLNPIVPFMFIFGMIGLGCLFLAPLVGISQIKHGEYLTGLKTIVIFGSIGFGLFIGWLWSVA